MSDFSGEHHIDTENLRLISGDYTEFENEESEWFSTYYNEAPIQFESTHSMTQSNEKHSNTYSTKNIENIDYPSLFHLYDKNGNHTGVNYNEDWSIKSISMDIPGSYYSGPHIQPQFIVINQSENTEFGYRIHNYSGGDNTVMLHTTAVTDSIPDYVSIKESIVLEDNVFIGSHQVKENFINFTLIDTVGLRSDTLNARVVSDPRSWSINSSNDEFIVDILIGELTDGNEVSNIDINTIRINDMINKIPGSGEILPSYDGFKGDVLKARFSGTELLDILPKQDTGIYLLGISFYLNDNRPINSGFFIGLDTPTTVTQNDDNPTDYFLSNNYPNPFNPSTKLQFGIPDRSHVQLTVYNTLGQKITTLVNQEIEVGSHEITFDASHLPSGVYIYRLQAGEYVESRKMLYLK